MGHRVFAGAHSKVLLSEAKLGQFVVRPSPLDFTQTSGPLPASEITTSPYGSIEGSRSSTYYEGGIYNRLGVMLPETTATGGTVTLVNQDTGTVAYDDSVPDDPENPFRVRQALVKALAALRPPAPSAGTETGQRDEGLASRSKEGTARSRSRVSKARMVASTGMSKADKALIRRLEQIERKVMAHEAAHISAGGGLVGPASFSYVQGPDGRMYAVGGEVTIKTGGESTPEGTVTRARRVRRAALAPADPSPADLQVAASAGRMEGMARAAVRAAAIVNRAAEASERVEAAEGRSVEPVVGRAPEAAELDPARPVSDPTGPDFVQRPAQGASPGSDAGRSGGTEPPPLTPIAGGSFVPSQGAGFEAIPLTLSPSANPVGPGVRPTVLLPGTLAPGVLGSTVKPAGLPPAQNPGFSLDGPALSVLSPELALAVAEGGAPAGLNLAAVQASLAYTGATSQGSGAAPASA